MRTQCSEMNDMGGFIFFEKSSCVCCVSSSIQSINIQHQVIQTYLRSPSLEPTKTQVSPSCFPKREPGSSVEMMCSIAFPTRPEPPVTRMVFLGDEDMDKMVHRVRTIIRKQNTYGQFTTEFGTPLPIMCTGAVVTNL